MISDVRGQVTEPATGYAPSWSPDSRLVAFHHYAELLPELGEDISDDDLCEIQVLNAGSGAVERTIARGVAPSWSPDGTMIAFANAGRIMVADSATSRSQLITEWRSEGLTFGSGPAPLVWSPDGRRLAYESVSEERQDEQNVGVYVVSVSGNEEPRLVAEGTNPVWSPDGQYVAYTVEEETSGGQHLGYSIYVISSDGNGEPRKIADGARAQWSPNWYRTGAE
jgi:Tol biopolymer transport system component